MSVIIRLKNLPISAGASDVRTFFSGLKIPDGAVHIIGGDEGEVFVGFASDEDARIAMTKDRSIIHGAEIRLLLSSKSEQNYVISARKNGTYASPKPQEDYVPPVPSQPHESQQSWEKNIVNPYAAKLGYEASYPPQNPNTTRNDNNALNNFNPRVEVPPQISNQPAVKPKGAFNGSYGGGYKQNFQQPLPSNVTRFVPVSHTSKPPEPGNVRTTPPVHRTLNQNSSLLNEQQFSSGRACQNKGGNNTETIRENSILGSSNERQSGGDSWRDTSYNQPPRSNFKNDFPNDFSNQYRNEFKSEFNEGKKFSQFPPRTAQPPEAHLPTSSHIPPQNGRKTLMPTPTKTFQNSPDRSHDIPLNHPIQTLPPSFTNQQRNGPPPFQNPLAASTMTNNINNPISAPVQTRLLPPFQASMGPPKTPVPVFNQPPAMAAMNAPAFAAAPVMDKFYIELTRLPNDLLRPAALEAFIRPTTPLTLSSVKTVFGPGGIHMHTIIRLDSIADYATMMRRNGEQGIKVQQSNKTAFDSAIDGVPIPTAAPPTHAVERHEDEDVKKNKRSRWENRSPRRSPPRRDHRDRTRSRSPPRRRRRSRSPRRREEHTDPTRWCIQVTNVPFRMKEEELLEWFAEKVRPAKLVRTYYSDGNASDRWIAEFSSESLMRRSFSIRTLCSGRSLKLSYIDNDKADEILKIVDVYGEEKRNKNENARMQQEEAEKANPPTFFNSPPNAHRGLNVHQAVPQSPMGPANGFNGIPPNGFNGPPPNGMNGATPGGFNTPPIRGGFAPRGNAFPPRGGMIGRGGHGGQNFYQHDSSNGPESVGQYGIHGSDSSFRGGFRGGFRGRGGGRGGFQGGFRNDSIHPTQNEFIELVQSIGPRGTVLSCTGFPNDVTLEDVVGFFADYEPNRNSIRIRRGDDGVMTGECMLACLNPENARLASRDLNGRKLRNSSISIHLV